MALYGCCRRGFGGLICSSKLMMSRFAECFSFGMESGFQRLCVRKLFV